MMSSNSSPPVFHPERTNNSPFISSMNKTSPLNDTTKSPDSPLTPASGTPYLTSGVQHSASASTSTLPNTPLTKTQKEIEKVSRQPHRKASSKSMRQRAGGEEATTTKRTKHMHPAHAVPSAPTQKIRHIPRIYYEMNAEPVPSMLMHWSKAPVHGQLPMKPMRAHTVTLGTDDRTAWIFGGCDEKECNSDVYTFDCDTMAWSRPLTAGDLPPPCRAHTATLIDNRLVILGGGQGGVYYDTVYVFNTFTRRWSRPTIDPSTTLPDVDPHCPAPRRAHTAIAYKGRIWMFGGGNGVQALNDVYALEYRSEGDPIPWKWHGPVRTTGSIPPPRGYHTATLVKNVMVVVGGSDGARCFDDVHCLNLDTLRWTKASLTQSYGRLSHSATLIGSYLFICGGHDGVNYVDSVLALNLVALQYEPRKILGKFPSPRGYHAAVMTDRRLFLLGGYQGQVAFDDVYTLDLASNGYLPDVISFSVGMGIA